MLCRDGVAGTTLGGGREARVSLGTLHYIFPSKEKFLVAVIEDTKAEVSAVLAEPQVDGGLEHAIRRGLPNYSGPAGR